MRPSRTLARRSAFLIAMAAAIAAVALSGADVETAVTTLDRTILDLNGDGRLEVAAGEPLLVREELAKAQTGRETRRAALTSFVGFTDFQLADEESPLRGPFTDLCGTAHPTISAFRPQETMVAHLINSNIRAANAIAAGPITGRPFDFGIQLGDAADNAQRNETRWFIDLLDGSAVNNPGTKLIDPDSGNHDHYEGPQGIEPWPAQDGRSILELANDPFFAPGLRRANGEPVPWYSVLGNHDAKVQGTVPNLPGWWEFAHLFAQGPLLVNTIGPDHLQALCADPTRAADPAFWMGVLARPGTTSIVTADGQRATLTRNQWAAEHLPPAKAKELDPAARGSKGLPAGHGYLDPKCTDASGAPLDRLCYSYDAAGIHYLVLDTNTDEGLEGGNLDLQQLAWLERELIAHSPRYYDAAGGLTTNPAADDSLVVVFSHHTKDSMDEDFPLHLKTTDHPITDRIDSDGRAFGEEFSSMLLRFPNVILHGAGHTHENRVWARSGIPTAPGKPGTGYWEVNSASHSDWPHQSRTFEIVDNKDGTLSIFGVLFDAAAPPKACHGDEEASDACLRWEDDHTHESAIQSGAADVNEEYLASVAREVGYNEPQGGWQADADARGRENQLVAGISQDRNVELLITNPSFASASSIKFSRAVAGSKFTPPGTGALQPGALPGGGLEGTAPSTSSSFTRTVGSPAARQAESPATTSAIPDWALASAALMFTASAVMLWIVRGRVRDWMLGVPVRRAPLG
ncbi:MAG TPA: hypothetical protein VJ922_04400 [Actinomycetota bacterium]|nr:hypothetical protein [Actinomycetota bacterium]